MCLGHSNWTICSPLRWGFSEIFPLSYFSYWGVQFLITITPEREKGKIWEKGNHQKWKRHLGFSAWGIQIGLFAVCWHEFFPKKCPSNYLSSHNKPFAETADCERRSAPPLAVTRSILCTYGSPKYWPLHKKKFKFHFLEYVQILRYLLLSTLLSTLHEK